MNFKSLKIILPLFVAIGLVGVGGFFLGQTFTSNPVSETSGLHAVHVGFACYKVRHADEPASVLYSGYDDCSHNVYTNMGKNTTAQYLFGASATKTAFTVISVGIANYSQTATDTCLDNSTAAGKICTEWQANGLQPAAGTYAEVVAGGGLDYGNVSITKTFTCTSCSSTVVNATGLYNNTNLCMANIAGCVLFAEANFTSATLQTNDQINVTWFIWTQ